MKDAERPGAATVLVWHQALCPECRRYAKCPEWHEILHEFCSQTWGEEDLTWLNPA